jgi:hypothetical protein
LRWRKTALAAVSVLDPTGLVSVANAFMHPICKADSPFPNVTAINNPVVQPQAQNGGTLNVGAILRTNEYVVSPSKKAYAIMQDDGNLVVYRGSGPSDNQGYVWGSVQVGGYAPSKGSYYAVMQDDGNLVVYRGSGQATIRAMYGVRSKTVATHPAREAITRLCKMTEIWSSTADPGQATRGTLYGVRSSL